MFSIQIPTVNYFLCFFHLLAHISGLKDTNLKETYQKTRPFMQIIDFVPSRAKASTKQVLWMVDLSSAVLRLYDKSINLLTDYTFNALP